MYRKADEIEKLRRIKEDSDREMVTALKQLKILSESRDLMQQELVELRHLRDAAQEVAEIVEVRKGMKMNRLLWRGSFEKYLKVSKGTSPRPPDSTLDMYSGW